MTRFQIQRMDRSGEWDEIFGSQVASLDEAIKVATSFARHDPKCAWGVRVYDAMAETVAFEP